MGSRWYSITVVVLWLATMLWLVSEKVIPPLLVGEPPSYRTIVQTSGRQLAAGWRLRINGERLGWAISTMKRLPNHTTEIYSRVHFDHVPIEQMVPVWMRAMLKTSTQTIAQLEIEAETMLTINPLGGLVDFDSALRAKPQISLVRVRGNVEGNVLKLSLQSGDMSYTPEINLVPEAIMGDSLSPQMRLPGLRLGQTWTVPSYSPLRRLDNPIEILHARVEEIAPLVWNGHTEETWLVVYRTDPRTVDDTNIRGRLWVQRNADGKVLRQQVKMFDSLLMFIRCSDEEAAELCKNNGHD